MTFTELQAKYPTWKLEIFFHPGREGSMGGEVGESPHWQGFGWPTTLDGAVLGRGYVCVKTDPILGEIGCANAFDEAIKTKQKSWEAEM